MKFGSLFSGIGGFDSGFETAGLECAWQCEIDPNCNTVLEKHYPDVRRYTDVKDISAANLEPVDVLCAGFPCQDLSVAGKRAGLAGERSGLWFEVYRIVAGTLPHWVCIENVPGLLSSNGGRDFGVIVRGLLDLGYCVAWRVLDAQFFGLAQRRRRVFIVGSLGDGSCAEILFESESSSRNSAPRREARARVAACVDGSPYADREAEHSRLIAEPFTFDWQAGSSGDESFRGKSRAWIDDKPGRTRSLTSNRTLAVAAPLTAGMSATPGVNQPGRRREDDENLVVSPGYIHLRQLRNSQSSNQVGIKPDANVTDSLTSEGPGAVMVAATLNSGGNSGGFTTEPGEHLVTHALSSEGADASEDGTGRGTPIVTVLRDERGRCNDGRTSDKAFPLHAAKGQSEQQIVAWHENKAGQISEAEVLGLRSGASHSYQGVGVRRLTPRECERLQGFPDDWTAGLSDSARYRMLGNAVAVPVAKWIGEQLIAALR